MFPVGIRLHNFQSFRGDHQIVLPTGLTQISGRNLDGEGSESNYSGKTTLLNSLAVCLYGRSPLVARSKGFVNEEEKWASVETLFSNHISIKRWIKHPEHGSKVQRGKDGVNLVEATQEEVDREFGSWDAFVATNFFCTNNSDFLEKVLKKPSDAKDLLTSLIPKLQVFDSALEWIKKQRNELVEDIEDLDLEISNFKGRVQSLKEMDYQKSIVEFERKREEEIRTAEKQIEYLLGRVMALGKLPDEKKLKSDLDLVSDDCSAKTKELSKIENKINLLNSHIKRDEEDLSDSKARSRSLEKGVCDRCGQKLPVDSKLSGKEEKYRKDLISELDGYKKSLKDSKSDRDTLSKKVSSLMSFKNGLLNKLQPVMEKTELLKEIQIGRDDLERLKKAINPYTDQEKKNKKDLVNFEAQLEAAEKHKQIKSDQLPYYEFWMAGFGARGIKNFVFDEIVFQLTETSKKYLDFMTDGAIRINFSPRKEKKGGGLIETIGVEIESNGRVLDDFMLRSQGERKRIGLSVGLGLNDLLSEMFYSPLEFMAYDEVFDGLDVLGVQRFCQLLRRQLKKTPQILAVSHNVHTEGLMDGQILVEKKDGVSRAVTPGGSGARLRRNNR